MAILMKVFGIFFASVLIVKCQEPKPKCHKQKLKLCVPVSLYGYCQQMQEEFPHLIQCISKPDRFECIRSVAEKESDVVNIDAQNIYVAGKFNLSLLAYEEISGAPYRYSSVALVSKNLQLSSLNDLQGKRSCHTGVGRTAGWQIPVSQLQLKGIMSSDCNGELATVSGFFSESCAPGTWSTDPIIDAELKRKYPNLCALCGDPEKCSRSDIYSGYQGAIQCIADGRGQVSFTKVDAVNDYLESNPGLATEFEYLCPDNTRRNITGDFDRSCSWGIRPSNAYAVADNIGEIEETRLYDILKQIFSRYSPNIPQIQNQRPEWFYKVLVSSEKTTDIIRTTTDNSNWSSYLGDFRYTMDRYFGDCQPKVVRFCTISDEGDKKCNDLGKVTLSRRICADIQCVRASSTPDCINLVKNGEADIITLDGGDVYKAGRYSELKPLAAELYGESDAKYYAVAIVPTNSQVTKIAQLQGLRSCHTGIGRTAGWVIPVGTLIEEGGMQVDQCNFAEAVSNYFSASCVPGANDTKYNPSLSGSEKLCEQCIGDEQGENKCSRGSEERYSGYAGAFRCLSEGKGDVAFVKHTTVPEYTNGESNLDWAKDLLSENFKLLCRKGGKDAIDNYRECNLARVPSHYVMTTGSVTPDDRLTLSKILVAISRYFGPNSENFNLFKPYDGKTDLLFKDSTTQLRAAPLDSTYRQVIGEEYYQAVEAVDPLVCSQPQ